MQPGGLFQVNEATNVFFMILRDCFISENAVNLSPQWVRKIGLHVYTSCEQGLYVWWQENVSQSKRWYDKFSLVKKIVRPIKTLIRQISLVKSKIRMSNNLPMSKIRILFHHSTARKSLYSYNKKAYALTTVPQQLNNPSDFPPFDFTTYQIGRAYDAERRSYRGNISRTVEWRSQN